MVIGWGLGRLAGARALLLALAGALVFLIAVAGQGETPNVDGRSGSSAAALPFSDGAFAPLPGTPTGHVSPAKRAQLTSSYGRLPLAFERNAGQFDARARYVARGSGYTLFLTRRGAVLSLAVGARGKRSAGSTSLSLGFADASSRPTVRGESPLHGRVNYLTGRGHGGRHTNLPTYARVRYRHLWPGIDAAFYGNQGRLEYDLDLAPGADPRRIGLSFTGADSIRVGGRGTLVIRVDGARVRELAPRAYQVVNGERRAVRSRYVMHGDRVGIALGRYDRRLPLVIDPVLTYSTFLGGSGAEFGNAIAVDASGAAYVAGFTTSTNFPTTVGAYQRTPADRDAFVTKLERGGRSLAYSTYLGGSTVDEAFGIAVDSRGAAYLAGRTASPDFPTTPGAFQTTADHGGAFAAKLAPNGRSLIYSTYLRGSDVDEARGVAIDASGRAYITGDTTSTDFPTTVGAYQRINTSAGGAAFVTKLAANGRSLAYSTYLGGSDGQIGYGVAVDRHGAAYVAGNTSSRDFPTTPGAPQRANHSTGSGGTGFVTKLTPDGRHLAYSTYLGGGNFDVVYGIAVDAAGSAYAAGGTASGDFPTTVGAYQTVAKGQDAFVAKLARNGRGLAYSTRIGGPNPDEAFGVATGRAGTVYVTGFTSSTGFPTTPGAFQPTLRSKTGGDAAFVTKLTRLGRRLAYSTYLGGSASDHGTAIAVDSAGGAYVTGDTQSADFPTTKRAAQTVFNGGGYEKTDAFVTKISGGPDAVTAGVRGVKAGRATLRCRVNAQGRTTTYRFEYGTSKRYGSRTTRRRAVSDSQFHFGSVRVAGLKVGTRYHFRVVASNASGRNAGRDQTFIAGHR